MALQNITTVSDAKGNPKLLATDVNTTSQPVSLDLQKVQFMISNAQKQIAATNAQLEQLQALAELLQGPAITTPVEDLASAQAAQAALISQQAQSVQDQPVNP